MASLEELLSANTAALEANTAAIIGGGSATSTTAAATGTGRGPGRPKKIPFEDVKAVAARVMTEKGRPAAVKLIQEHGADQLANLAEAKYPVFIAACEALLAAEVAETQGDEPPL